MCQHMGGKYKTLGINQGRNMNGFKEKKRKVEGFSMRMRERESMLINFI